MNSKLKEAISRAVQERMSQTPAAQLRNIADQNGLMIRYQPRTLEVGARLHLLTSEHK